MTDNPDLGRQLFELLPAIYRTRDDGALEALLAAFGDLLNPLYRTIDQRLADAFPDLPSEGRTSQDWVLPYLADLLDVGVVSADALGRRAEIEHAIAWRQRKGTLPTIESIAETLGRIEVEVHEGWARVVTTPRFDDMARLSWLYDSTAGTWSQVQVGLPAAKALGALSEPDMTSPSLATRHPGLPTATVDLRCPSRAVACAADNPAARTSNFDGHAITWRQASRHGAPCFPRSYEDVSRRTVDLRTPSFRTGHHHPRRLLLHAAPPAGLFPTRRARMLLPSDAVEISRDGDALLIRFPLTSPQPTLRRGTVGLLRIKVAGVDHGVPVVIDEVSDARLALLSPKLTLPSSTLATDASLQLGPVVDIPWAERDAPEFSALLGERVEDDSHRFSNRTTETPWALSLRIEGVIECGTHSGDDERLYVFEDLHLDHRLLVHSGRLRLLRCAARTVEIHTIDLMHPVLDARDSLFESLQAARGLSRLEACTVLQKTLSQALQASECLFLGPLRRHHDSLLGPSAGCLRYSRIEPDQTVVGVSTFRVTRERVEMHSATFGERSCGVLHPAASDSTRHGAEDGGELGAYHEHRYCLRESALARKLEQFSPVGVEAILIPDPRLLEEPR